MAEVDKLNKIIAWAIIIICLISGCYIYQYKFSLIDKLEGGQALTTMEKFLLILR